MIETIVFLFGGAGVVALIASFFLEKMGARVIVQSLALLLFIAASIGSLQIEEEHCFAEADNVTSTECLTSINNDVASAWAFGIFALLAAGSIFLSALGVFGE